MSFGFQGNAFQHSWGFQGGTTVTPPTPTPSKQDAGQAGRKRKQQRRTLVEIDGVEYVVRGEYEARELLAEHQQQIIAKAEGAAKAALNKARDIERKTGKLPVLEVAIPELEAEEGAPEEIRQLFIEAQRGVDEAYLRSAQELELGFLARRAYLKQDEEDVNALFALGVFD